jgi:hypothetical protein
MGRKGLTCSHFRQYLAVHSGRPPLVPKNDPEALRKVLSDNAHGAQLGLITCGGDLDLSYRASADNVVAFAAQA